MADLNEAFNTMKFEQKQFHSIDYFFTQRNLKEDHEFLDQNMNRKNKQVNIQYNFLAISIPHYDLQDGIISTIEADIFGDNGYHYNGKIISQAEVRAINPEDIETINISTKMEEIRKYSPGDYNGVVVISLRNSK